MFEKVSIAPPDPVFGLADRFRHDPRPGKINLTVGAYQNAAGITPVLDCVKQAETKLLRDEKTKNYLPIDGSASLNKQIARLVFGDSHAVFLESRYATAHTPGGTAALRIAADLLKHHCGTTKIWNCDPTWANHPQIFSAAGLKIEKYPYLTSCGKALNFEGIIAALAQAQPMDAVLLHTVCHNPTGFDFDRDQWLKIFALLEERELIPLFDFAYQGFGVDVQTDAWPVREYLSRGHEALICTSFSKSLGLYGERTGAITAIVADQKSQAAVLSQIKSIIRTLYSTPPLHGGAIVDAILHDVNLYSLWLQELEEMRNRIQEVRLQFVAKLKELAPQADFSFVGRQNGMFSFSGLSREQVVRLREENAIYAVESGRINVAGINDSNLEQLCQCIVDVL